MTTAVSNMPFPNLKHMSVCLHGDPRCYGFWDKINSIVHAPEAGRQRVADCLEKDLG
jgi:hypothetical protein